MSNQLWLPWLLQDLFLRGRTVDCAAPLVLIPRDLETIFRAEHFGASKFDKC